MVSISFTENKHVKSLIPKRQWTICDFIYGFWKLAYCQNVQIGTLRLISRRGGCEPPLLFALPPYVSPPANDLLSSESTKNSVRMKNLSPAKGIGCIVPPTGIR